MAYRESVILPAQTLTVTGAGAASPEVFGETAPSAVFQLKVGSPVSGTTPNLVVKVEDSIDGGTTWNTVLTFTAVTAANAVQVIRQAGPFGRLMRATWVITGTTPSFAGVEVRVG